MEEKLMQVEVQENVYANEIAAVKAEASQLKVVDDASYQIAGNVLTEIKTKQKMVKEYFAPLKEAANKAHKAITSKESETLKPLEEIERSLKSEMSNYFMEQERKKREAEALLRKQIEEEKRRALAEAEKLEKEGKTEESDMAFQQAVDAEEMAMFTKVEVEKPKVKGVGTQKDWELTITDEAKVPAYIMGACVRPVDLMAIKKLVKATEGKIRIDGISINETVIIKGGTR